MEWVWRGRAARLCVGVKSGCVWKVGCLRITEGVCVEAGKDYLRRAECELYECALGKLAGMALDHGGDRRVWAQTHYGETDQGRMLSWFLLSFPPQLPRKEGIGEGLE